MDEIVRRVIQKKFPTQKAEYHLSTPNLILPATTNFDYYSLTAVLYFVAHV